MKSFYAYEMQYIGKAPIIDEVQITPFCEKYYAQYEHIYNECFYEMREALDVEPYNFYSDIEQIRDRMPNIFMLLHNETIMGSVGCYGTEIDDLIVNKQFQNRGYGKTLLLWGIHHIRTYTEEPITIHVAEWNQNALKLYTRNGFVVTKRERVH